jgi:hypothetical protein
MCWPGDFFLGGGGDDNVGVKSKLLGGSGGDIVDLTFSKVRFGGGR